MSSNFTYNPVRWVKLTGITAMLSISCAVTAQVPVVQVGTDQNALFGVEDNVRDFLSANRGTAGGGNQSLQAGDALSGTEGSDVLIGALGIDVLFGEGGDDILIGGTEDFNPFNRDRAFGGTGDDVFLWAPGDGNDFFDGGDGIDVVMLGLIGEERDTDGGETGAPFFNVNPPASQGSQDFDGIYINPANGLPMMNVAGGPGFCEVVDGRANDADGEALAALALDHLVRFILRGPASDISNPDTGLRIAIHLLNTEFLVCGGETPGETVVIDLTVSPPAIVDVADLPANAFNLIF